jgi:hypothetical protein
MAFDLMTLIEIIPLMQLLVCPHAGGQEVQILQAAGAIPSCASSM